MTRPGDQLLSVVVAASVLFVTGLALWFAYLSTVGCG